MAIIFDLYGTLLDVHSAAGHNRALLGDRTDLVSLLWRTRQLEYAWAASLSETYTDFWTLTERALDTALHLGGVPEPDAVRAPLLQAYTRLDPFPEVEAVLTALKDRGVPLLILSNGAPDMLSRALAGRAMTPLFDTVLSVDAARIYKPSPRAYQIAQTHLCKAPGDIQFVSSNAWDAAGAARFGFRASWLNRAKGPWEYPDHGPVPAIADLKALLTET